MPIAHPARPFRHDAPLPHGLAAEDADRDETDEAPGRISLEEAIARVKAWHTEHDPVMSPGPEARDLGRDSRPT